MYLTWCPRVEPGRAHQYNSKWRFLCQWNYRTMFFNATKQKTVFIQWPWPFDEWMFNQNQKWLWIVWRGCKPKHVIKILIVANKGWFTYFKIIKIKNFELPLRLYDLSLLTFFEHIFLCLNSLFFLPSFGILYEILYY